MKSIQSRLGTGLLISLIAVFFILWLLVSSSIQSLAENYIASRLHHDIETILTSVDFDKDNKISIHTERIDPVYQRPFSGHYYNIQYKNNALRSRSLWDQTLDSPTPDSGEYITSYQTGPESQTLIVVSSQFIKSNQSLTISVAEDLSPVIHDINKFKNHFALISASILLILLIIQAFILRGGLKPLLNIKSQLTDLEQGNIEQLSDDAPNELKPLIYEINHLLVVLQQRLKRSRDALSDLSHAIKKPLTVLQQVNHDQTSQQQISNIQQLTDRILKRARLSGGSYTGALFDFDSDISALINTIKAMYPDKSIDIDTEIKTSTNTYFDREDMLELLGNLLDNAYKWADSHIIITIDGNNELAITIEDDGKGCKPDSLNQLTERGIRLDESVSGYGFGIAIVSDIVNDYGGTLSFDRSGKLGGFKVDIVLPVRR